MFFHEDAYFYPPPSFIFIFHSSFWEGGPLANAVFHEAFLHSQFIAMWVKFLRVTIIG